MKLFTADRFQVFLAVLVLSLFVLGFRADIVAAATPTFRGVSTDITNAQGQSNRLFVPSFGRGAPWYIDVQDSFGREGLLIDGYADVWNNGFVPPFAGVPDGPLTGEAANAAGRWMGHSIYRTQNGKVTRANSSETAVACVPWRITPDLGDDYLITLTAVVAEGESVRLGYFGDVEVFGTDRGLSSQLGQLVLDVGRGRGDNRNLISWSVAWDMNGNRQTFTSTAHAASDEELQLQLAWIDDNVTHDDLFDAAIQTSQGRQLLLAGNMSTAIEVHGFGFQILGEQSFITEIVAAVPEPEAGVLLLLGLVGCRRRRI